jgi:DNA-binding NarL/FixJ family response regulator
MTPDTQRIRVSLYEDNTALRESLCQLIGVYPEFQLAGAYPNAMNILNNIETDRPDVIVMDIDMPGISGVEAVEKVHKKHPGISIMMQTVFDDEDKIFSSICAGAVGYMLKKTKPADILEAIRQADSGGSPMSPSIATKVLKMFRHYSPPVADESINLSEREKEVLSALTQGRSYKMIAEGCGISLDTVRFHIKKIYEKLHVHSMTEAVSKALRERLI